MAIAACDATIVVVEDNADNLFIVLDILEGDLDATSVYGFDSGKQLFEMLDANDQMIPDLILLDIQMPFEDGYTVLQKIRARPHLAPTRVVAVTANVMPHDVERARQAGFDGFIGKPIDADRFPLQIKRVLDGESVWESR